MAVYKVLQDIESEDKIIGPLTFKKAIFAAIMFVSLFIAWKFAAIPPKPFWGLIPAIFVSFPMGLLAFYPSRDQPVEVLLAAKIRFALKPRKRLWNQSGIKELVTITVPKKIEKHLTKDFTQHEVHSRLAALASTIDSRGWAVKNVDVNLYQSPGFATSQAPIDSDRLVSGSTLPVAVADYTVTAEDDVLDQQNNPVAQHFDQMMRKADIDHKNQMLANMDAVRNGAPIEQFVPAPNQQQTPQPFYQAQPQQQYIEQTIITPATTVTAEDEQQLLAKIHETQEREKHFNRNGGMKVILPPSEQQTMAQTQPQAPSAQPASQAQTPRHQQDSKTLAQAQKPGSFTPNPAILELAKNDDLNVATIARQASRQEKKSGDFSDEVVVSLR